MGINKADECIFCERELEEHGYGGFEPNGERASEEYDEDLNICKRCALKLKKILDKISEAKEYGK